MPREVSSTYLESIFAQTTSAAHLILLEITSPEINNIYVTSDAVETEHNSTTYEPYPFNISLPSQHQDQLDEITLEIDNVSRTIVSEVRQIQEPPDVTFKVVLGESPDTIEVGPVTYKMRNVTHNALTVSGQLTQPDIINDTIPYQSFTPNNFPGLF
jgi:hypothetical protein